MTCRVSKNKLWFTALAQVSLAVASLADVVTDPVGFIQVATNPGTGSARALTVLSFPLLNTTNVTGASSGKIDAVSANTLTCSAANWAAGELSQATKPKLIRITSGAAVGRTFLISTSATNTSITLTLASSETTDLTTLGIVTGTNGDSFKIYDCATLGSLFGTPATFAFVGNANPDLADNVLLLISGTWSTFYYNTTLNRWTRRSFGNPDATNQAVKPDTAILFSSIGTSSLTLVATGTVPTTSIKNVISKSGLTFLGNNWPTDVTLFNSGIQSIPGWQANANVNNADQVLLLVNGTWSTFYWDGTNWRRRSFGNPVSNTQLIPAGAGIILSKVSATASDSLLTQTPPY